MFVAVKKLTTITKRPRLALQDDLALGLDSELEVSKQNIADEEKNYRERFRTNLMLESLASEERALRTFELKAFREVCGALRASLRQLP